VAAGTEVDWTALGALLSGGSTTVLAALVWLGQRDSTRVLMSVKQLLGRIAEQRGVKELTE
jgi:hypothetical protein